MKRILFFYLLLATTSALFSQEFDTITDARDGQEYRIVKIGEQWWMAENLRATHYADGTPITIIESETEWDSLESTAKAYCWYNNDSSTNAKTYGALYTWTGAMNGSASSNLNPSGVQGVCPIGWHLPSRAEWLILAFYLGREYQVAGGKMKSTGTDLWQEPNMGATNESGFTALPASFRDHYGNYGPMGGVTIFHASSVRIFNEVDYADYIILYYDQSACGFGGTPDIRGFSIRCLQNSNTSATMNTLPNKLQVFPNPMKERANIHFSNPNHEVYRLILTDLTGKVVKIMDNITEDKIEINRDGLKEGMYLIELRGPEIYRGKILIE